VRRVRRGYLEAQSSRNSVAWDEVARAILVAPTGRGRHDDFESDCTALRRRHTSTLALLVALAVLVYDVSESAHSVSRLTPSRN